MALYYTKCGKKFIKSTNAATTGFVLETDENGALIETCRLCPFPEIRIKKDYVVYECRSGSEIPNLTNTLSGNLNDMNAIRILSLNLDFLNSIYDHAKEDPELVPYWCKDSSDCRKVISISCSKNKKGIVAKKKLVEKFFKVKVE